MDSQHRHELQENELAHWLELKIEQLKPHLTLIVLGLVAVVAIVAAWNYYQEASLADTESEWDLYTTAMLDRSQDLSVLQAVTDELEGGAADNWASITLADGKLYEATRGWLNDREQATEALQEARERYQQLKDSRDVNAAVRQRAQFGLARTYELEGDLDKAREHYLAVGGEFEDLAAERAKALESEDVQQAIEWLKTAQAPAYTLPTGPATPDQTPEFAPDSLDTPAADDGQSSEQTLEDILGEYQRNTPDESDAETSEGEASQGDAPDADADAQTEADDPSEPADE